MEHDPCLGGYEQRWRTSLAHGQEVPVPKCAEREQQVGRSGAVSSDQGLCSTTTSALCLSV